MAFAIAVLDLRLRRRRRRAARARSCELRSGSGLLGSKADDVGRSTKPPLRSKIADHVEVCLPVADELRRDRVAHLPVVCRGRGLGDTRTPSSPRSLAEPAETSSVERRPRPWPGRPRSTRRPAAGEAGLAVARRGDGVDAGYVRHRLRDVGLNPSPVTLARETIQVGLRRVAEEVAERRLQRPGEDTHADDQGQADHQGRCRGRRTTRVAHRVLPGQRRRARPAAAAAQPISAASGRADQRCQRDDAEQRAGDAERALRCRRRRRTARRAGPPRRRPRSAAPIAQPAP